MPELELRGIGASPGMAAGPALVLRPPERGGKISAAGRARALTAAREALAAAGAELEALASELPAAEAAILETGALMAADPTLAALVEAEVGEGSPAAEALLAATERLAADIAAVEDEMLAARAADVLSLGRRAARIASGARVERAVSGSVLIARDLGPADVAEMGSGLVGVALAAGGSTAHAAIVARSLGLPMVVGLGDDLLTVRPGAPVVVDGDIGTATLAAGSRRTRAAGQAQAARNQLRLRARSDRDLAAVTRDGRTIQVLVNAASAAEVAAGVEAGAEGVGLLRTEIAFLQDAGWPSLADHARLLKEVAAAACGRPIFVRLLDFGGDKTPPFLAGAGDRGIELLARHPDHLADQLAAIEAAARSAAIRVLVPMVSRRSQLRAVREALGGGAPVGPMIEVPAAVTMADSLAAESAFFSIGTNDLTQYQLGLDRAQAGTARAHHPAVLRLIQKTLAAAAGAGIPVEVCGEAASDPVTLPLLVGLGVVQLSVGAARVGEVRRRIRSLDHGACRRLAASALGADSQEEVEGLVGSLG